MVKKKQSRYKTLEKFPPDKTCSFCKESEIDIANLGTIYKYNDVFLHYLCLLSASEITQGGEDRDGLLGFYLKDIRIELKRGENIICSYCKKKGATISCFDRTCNLIFHLPCGVKNGSLHQYNSKIFKSFCKKHRPTPDIPKNILANNPNCPLCCSQVNVAKEAHIWPPCCNPPNAILHKICSQYFAANAGYLLKCPLCNDRDVFGECLRKFGVYVPDREATWEIEEEMRRIRDDTDAVACEAGDKTCKCPRGVKFSIKRSLSWYIELCTYCGSGRHLGCMEVPLARNEEYLCKACAPIARRGFRDDEVAEGEEAVRRRELSKNKSRGESSGPSRGEASGSGSNSGEGESSGTSTNANAIVPAEATNHHPRGNRQSQTATRTLNSSANGENADCEEAAFQPLRLRTRSGGRHLEDIAVRRGRSRGSLQNKETTPQESVPSPQNGKACSRPQLPGTSIAMPLNASNTDNGESSLKETAPRPRGRKPSRPQNSEGILLKTALSIPQSPGRSISMPPNTSDPQNDESAPKESMPRPRGRKPSKPRDSEDILLKTALSIPQSPGRSISMPPNASDPRNDESAPQRSMPRPHECRPSRPQNSNGITVARPWQFTENNIPRTPVLTNENGPSHREMNLSTAEKNKTQTSPMENNSSGGTAPINLHRPAPAKFLWWSPDGRMWRDGGNPNSGTLVTKDNETTIYLFPPEEEVINELSTSQSSQEGVALQIPGGRPHVLPQTGPPWPNFTANPSRPSAPTNGALPHLLPTRKGCLPHPGPILTGGPTRVMPNILREKPGQLQRRVSFDPSRPTIITPLKKIRYSNESFRNMPQDNWPVIDVFDSDEEEEIRQKGPNQAEVARSSNQKRTKSNNNIRIVETVSLIDDSDDSIDLPLTPDVPITTQSPEACLSVRQNSNKAKADFTNLKRTNFTDDHSANKKKKIDGSEMNIILLDGPETPSENAPSSETNSKVQLIYGGIDTRINTTAGINADEANVNGSSSVRSNAEKGAVSPNTNE